MSLFAERLHDPALINEAFRLRDQHYSLRAISEQTGIPHSTLGDYLNGVGECFYEFRCAWCGEETVKFRPSAIYCCEDCKEQARGARRRAATRMRRLVL